MSTQISDFIKSNLFALINLVTLIVGLGFFAGAVQSAVETQNAEIQRMRQDMRSVRSLAGETSQNTADIRRLRGADSSIQSELLTISEQISSMDQWVKDHQTGGGG